MFLFGKKPKKKIEKGIPIDMVRNLASKGMSDQEIVAVLRKQGYSPYEIERALSLALKSTITQNTPSQISTPQSPAPQEKIPIPKPPEQPFSPKPFPSPPSQQPEIPEFHTVPYPEQKEESQPIFTFEKTPFFPSPKEETQEISQELKEIESSPLQTPTPEITLEEIIEGIIADKWTKFEEIIERLRKRDDELQKQIIDIRKELDSIKDAMRKSEENFLTKLEEHSEHVASIEAKIGSIEKVFKEFLPELTESMRLITEALEKSKKS
ncbi:MAG TPA: hypothetical protein EYH56_02725 [Nanoarchaeota archaeon]|nr:hypothetical protein [Nanoarchaeota archaeon]